MKVIAAIQVDLSMTPLGTVSRLGMELAGSPILQHTVRRVERIETLSGIYVLCPEPQVAACRDLVAGSRAEVVPFAAGVPPWQSLVQTARKWSLDGWRGGVGGSTSYDEFTDCRLLARLLEIHPCDAVLSVPAAAPLLSPQLATGMIQLLEATSDDSRMIFTQAPPGLTGLLMQEDLVRELASQNIPIGWVFTYKPDAPQKDAIFLPCCYELPPDLRYASGRLIADTERSLRRVAALVAEGVSDDPAAVGRWLRSRDESHLEARPHEVEIELTTDDPYPDALLRPRGPRVPARGPIPVDMVQRIAVEMSEDDDALIVLGGFGDPLRHPQFADVLAAIRRAAGGAPRRCPLGICVRTTGVDLTDEVIEQLIEHRVDVLHVSLDAWTPELYGRLQSPSDPSRASLESVRARLDRLSQQRQQRQTVAPLIVPDFTKSRDNMHEMDAFYDGWVRHHGAVSITGACHYAGQCDDRSVIRMTPPMRGSCRRLNHRCMVLADGTVTACDQDFRGAHPIGHLAESSLAEVWRGETMQRLRRAHTEGKFDEHPLCAACDEWHRP